MEELLNLPVFDRQPHSYHHGHTCHESAETRRRQVLAGRKLPQAARRTQILEDISLSSSSFESSQLAFDINSTLP